MKRNARRLSGGTTHPADRRKHERKLVSETYLEWSRRPRNWWRRGKADRVTVLELSAEGARVVAPKDDTITVGTTLGVQLGGERASAVVRWIGEDGSDPTRAVYGLAFADAGKAFNAAIAERLEAEQSTFEWVWEHTR